MFRKKIIMGVVLSVLMALMASAVFAGSTSFNVVVPKLGGKSNTNTTTKSTTANQWVFSSLTVGGNKSVNFRSLLKASTVVGNWYPGTTGTTINAPYTSTRSVGDLINGQIGTNWNELVNVQVQGNFDSK